MSTTSRKRKQKEIAPRDEYDFAAAQFTQGDKVKRKVRIDGEVREVGEKELAKLLRAGKVFEDL